MLSCNSNKPILRAVSVVLISGLLLSGAGIPSYAVTNPSDSALAPPLRTAAGEIVYDEEANKWDISTHNDVVRYWDEETRRSVIDGVEVAGKKIKLPDKSFRNRWAFEEISYLIAQMLKITKKHKLYNMEDLLISSIGKHVRNRGGMGEVLLEGFDIDRIKTYYKK